MMQHRGVCLTVLIGILAALSVPSQADELLKLSGCSQSSTFEKYLCNKAIDGNTDQNLHTGSSCSHTNEEMSWWTASTEKLAQISEVKIFNRKDCCPERLRNFVITVDGIECASFDFGVTFTVKTFKCDMVGQHVMIKSRIKTYLSICEVQVFGEYVVAGKGEQLKLSDCSQSSTFEKYLCNKAIDGNTDQNIYASFSCSHTNSEMSWWTASTEKPAHISEVRIFNRIDDRLERLRNFVITVDGIECASFDSGVTFSVKTFNCDMIGQHLMIKSRVQTFLTLCEVQVFGQFVSRASGGLLKLHSCSQSSDHEQSMIDGVRTINFCARAIDGNTNQNSNSGHSCSHTNNEMSWWTASTERPAHVMEIKIFNRLDCCFERLSNFVVTVDGAECGSYNSDGVFSVMSFKCDKVGQKITVRSRKATPLTLCEVQVFGEFASQPSDQLKLIGCSQSSNFMFLRDRSHPWPCNRAIDGYINILKSGPSSCTHTNEEMSWWTASTEKLAHISEVKIFNRQDCCPERLRNFVITVDGIECAAFDSGVTFTIKAFKCDMVGQHVMIKSRIKTYLTLCEVQVFGKYVAPPSNGLLKLHSCSQSSDHEQSLIDGVRTINFCARAIDGNTNQNSNSGHSCSHTNNEMSWWTASTERPAHVKEVKIFNRLDCCPERLSNFVVTVDGAECGSYNSDGVFSVMSFKCDKVGQKITVRSRKATPLTLCEVQVFGELTIVRPTFKSEGCHVDRTDFHDLEKHVASDLMTQRKCNSLCAKLEYTYFGLQAGTQCWCTRNYGGNGQVDQSECQMACTGDPGDTCGGELRNAVFAVDRTLA